MQVAFTVLLVLVGSTYWFVQVVQGAYYRELAENNRMRTLPIQAPRGLIYDREGRLLVENLPSYNLLLDLSRNDDPEPGLAFAASVLGRPVGELVAVVERQKGAAPFKTVLLAEDLSLSQVARFAVAALEYPEFEIDVGHLRLYRHGPLTAHVLGHLGEATAADLSRLESPHQAGDLVGRKGVEGAFDALLRGRDGERVIVVDSYGRLRRESGRSAAQPGGTLRLALDLELQQIAARYFEGRVGAAVALEPKTGEILVMVSAPSYNPNLFARRLQQSSWRKLLAAAHQPLQNRAIQNTYSPGSIFKIVLAVAGLTEGAVEGRDAVFCGGAVRIHHQRFRCWKRSGHGWVSLRKAIKESCDVYFYLLGQELGIDRIAHYARLFGLGRLTGLDFGGEKRGLVPDTEWSLSQRGSPWYPGETISVAIGQGPLLVTPLQMASLMALVANGGSRVEPRVTLGTGRPEPKPQNIDPEALEAVREGLWAVVNERGTGAAAAVAGVEVAGKTGTVQVVQQKTWVESEDLPFERRDHGWFASFARAGQRQLAVVVFVEHGGRGSRVAAPLAKLLYEGYFRDVLDARSPA
jgi:penicillin-binding protein 2